MPQASFSDILDDAIEAFRCLVDDRGLLPSHVALAGDSAGGHLALALAARLCAESPKQARAVTDNTASPGSDTSSLSCCRSRYICVVDVVLDESLYP